MILIDRAKLKFLLAGRTVSVATAREGYRRGRVYAVGVRHNRTLCRAEVLSVTAADGGFMLELCRRPDAHTPRLLARSPGGQRTDYVSDPAAAAADEPEAVDAETQARISKLGTVAWAQEHALRQAERQAMHWHERLERLERERAAGADVSGELRVIRDRLRQLRERAA